MLFITNIKESNKNNISTLYISDLKFNKNLKLKM